MTANPHTAEVRILIIDDHVLFREGLSRLLEKEPGRAVVGGASTVAEGIEQLRKQNADIILLDFDLGAERAFDFISELKMSADPGQVLILTAGVNELEAVELIQQGVVGIFHKHNPPDALCECIRQVSRGEVWLEKKYLKPLFRVAGPSEAQTLATFTERERHVLRGVFQGRANKEIADQLRVSETTVKGTLQQLFEKTGVRTRTQLVRVALERFRDQFLIVMSVGYRQSCYPALLSFRYESQKWISKAKQ